jgi:hypothetical protein
LELGAWDLELPAQWVSVSQRRKGAWLKRSFYALVLAL